MQALIAVKAKENESVEGLVVVNHLMPKQGPEGTIGMVPVYGVYWNDEKARQMGLDFREASGLVWGEIVDLSLLEVEEEEG